MRHLKSPEEAVVVVEREANAKITMSGGRRTRENLMEEIKMETITILETVIKREEIDRCANASAINVYGTIPTPLGFMLSGRMI